MPQETDLNTEDRVRSMPCSAPSVTEQEWEELLTLLYGAWEDSGLMQEEEGRLARMLKDRHEWTDDSIERVAARVEWMRDFYQRVVLPQAKAQNGVLCNEGRAATNED